MKLLLLNIFTFVISPLLFGYGCSQIAQKKGRNTIFWFIIGAFFGLLALILIALLPPLGKKLLNSNSIHAPTPRTLPPLTPIFPSHEGKLWYYLDLTKQQFGPMSLDRLSREWHEKKIEDATLVWNEELTDWKPLRDVVKI